MSKIHNCKRVFYWAISLTNKSSAQYSTSLQIDSKHEKRLIPMFDRVYEEAAAASSSSSMMTNYSLADENDRTAIIENGRRKRFSLFLFRMNWHNQ